MRAVVQRVSHANVVVDGEQISEIGTGLLVLVGVGHDDNSASAEALARKILNLRVMEDAEGRMNVSVKEQGGEILAVSQFTLFGDCRKGRRPSYVAAAKPTQASPLFDHFVAAIQESGTACKVGQFGADMNVTLLNRGPVTLLIDTEKHF